LPGTKTAEVRRKGIKKINKIAKKEKKQEGKYHNGLQVKFLIKRKKKKRIKHNYSYIINMFL
jgi:hypothetical protein